MISVQLAADLLDEFSAEELGAEHAGAHEGVAPVALHGVTGDLQAGAGQRDEIVGFGQARGDDVDTGDPRGGEGDDVQDRGDLAGDLGDFPAPFGQVRADVFPPVLVVDAVGLGVVKRLGTVFRCGDAVIVCLVRLRCQRRHVRLGVAQVGLCGVVRGLGVGHGLRVGRGGVVLLRRLQIGRSGSGVGGGALQINLRVGFIGVGDQGALMAQAIADSAFDLHAWARRPESLEILAGFPYTVHTSPAELAAAVDILALCLRDDDDVWDILNALGVRAAFRPGLIIVNHGTGDPGENQKIAEHLAGLGVAYLDAPVSGGGAGARARAVTTMVGGARDAFDACEPVFATFSRQVAFMGPSGSGQTTKLLNNAMTMSNLKNAVDLIRLASRLDIDVKAVVDVIGASSGASSVLRSLGTDLTPEIAPHIQSLMRKDIEHFADAVRARGLDPHELRDRGLAGADGLVEAVTLLVGGTAA